MSAMRTTPLVVALLLVGAAAGAAGALLFLPREAPPAGEAAASARRYFCPMHPSMVSDRPGNCPICQMRMVPVQEGQHAEAGAHALDAARAVGPAVPGRAAVRIALDRQQLIGVKLAAVERRPLVRTIRTVGSVTFDESRLHHVHTKVAGWIERLYADTTGFLVREGDPLLTLYSPELVASQQEYLLALKARDRLAGSSVPSAAQSGDDLVSSARRRLRLFDMTDEQIAALEHTGEVTRTTTIYSPVTGHVIERRVAHGEKIESGTTLLEIADLSRVWVIGDVYAHELPFVRPGQGARMSLSYLPGRPFEGRVVFIYPVLSGQTRTVKVRLEFANPDLTLKPEMYADLEIESELGVGLVVPDTAVISTGERDIAFVDRGEGTFEPRELRLGVRLEDSVQVLEGLAEGEEIVVSGTFLIDSESRLKAAMSGETSAAGHRH